MMHYNVPAYRGYDAVSIEVVMITNHTLNSKFENKNISRITSSEERYH